MITLGTIDGAEKQLKDGPLGVGLFIVDTVASLAAIIQAGSHALSKPMSLESITDSLTFDSISRTRRFLAHHTYGDSSWTDPNSHRLEVSRILALLILN